MSYSDESATQQHSSAPTLRWAMTVAVVISWLFVVIAAYFGAHKPFDADVITELGQSWLSVAIWLGWRYSPMRYRLSLFVKTPDFDKQGRTLHTRWTESRG